MDSSSICVPAAISFLSGILDALIFVLFIILGYILLRKDYFCLDNLDLITEPNSSIFVLSLS